MATKIRDQFINKTGKIGKQWGIGEPAGKVWGTLLFSEKPLTQKEICKQSSYSIGLVSRSITILENLGMVSDVGRENKEKLYQASVSAADFLGKLMINLLENNIKPIISLLEENKMSVSDKKVKERMSTLIDDYSIIKSTLNDMPKILKKVRK